MSRDDDIFADALALPPAERAAFLATACGPDPERRQRLERLLASAAAAPDFLAAPLHARIEALPTEEKPGDAIGRYTLREKIGEGGCGVVWLAEQKIPVRRRVALKVIKLGMDTREVIARFEAERQALALMDHPNIARVFDGGATDTGRPYFVMELVRGVPITTHCDTHQLTPAQRLELFIAVCQAIQHAHQKGIIHRDIKPSNILVTLNDGVAVPKVIDFGIAKATQGRLTDQTIYTAFHQFIGTPAYMSPEQAEMSSVDVDTRSDIYSLGVLLYELLTGETPFDRRDLSSAGLDEIRRRIRHVEPPRPSARFRTLEDAAQTTVAHLRGIAPQQLSTVLHGDLDWIVMRCLEKDRTRRYGNAQDLAHEIRRYLRHETIHARPPQTIYRVRKFIARHQLACASAAAIAAALIAGTVVSVRQAIRATEAEQAARAERDTATAAQRAEALARTDAQRRQEQAEDLVAFMLGDFRAELKNLGKLSLLDAVGEKAIAYFTALDPRDLTDAALTRQAKALTQIGEIRMDQAQYGEAERAFTTAYDRTAALTLRWPKNAEMLLERGQAEHWMGYVAYRRRQWSTAEHWFLRYRDSATALLLLDDRAERHQRELGYAEQSLAVLKVAMEDYAAAAPRFAAEGQMLERLLAVKSVDVQLRHEAAINHSWQGVIAERRGDFQRAVEHFGHRITFLESLMRDDPRSGVWPVKCADGYLHQGVVLAVLGRHAEAVVALAQARQLIDASVAKDPRNREWSSQAALVQITQAGLALSTSELESARSLLHSAGALLSTVVTAEPSSPSYAEHLSRVWRYEARLHLASQRPALAAEAVEKALRLLQPFARENVAADRIVRSGLADAHLVAAKVAIGRADRDRAAHHWESAALLLLPHVPQSSDWRLLDPAARTLAHLGRERESAALIERLSRFGYRPLEPWDTIDPHLSAPRNAVQKPE